MDTQKIKLIRVALILAIVVGLIAVNVYTLLLVRKQTEVINRQGNVLKLMIDTPEINAVVAKYVEQLKAQGAK